MTVNCYIVVDMKRASKLRISDLSRSGDPQTRIQQSVSEQRKCVHRNTICIHGKLFESVEIEIITAVTSFIHCDVCICKLFCMYTNCLALCVGICICEYPKLHSLHSFVKLNFRR